MPRTKCSFLLLQHVSSRVFGFPVVLPCVWGKLQNLSCFKVSKQVVTWFCVASVPLRDILTCLQKVSKFLLCGRRILLRPFQKLNSNFSGRCSTTLHFNCTLHTPHFTLYTLNSTLYTLHSTLYTLHFTRYTPHFTLYIPHFTLFTLHSTLYTPHSTLYTLHSTLHTLHSTLLHSTLHTLHSTLYTPQATLYSSRFTFGTPHYTFYNLRLTCALWVVEAWLCCSAVQAWRYIVASRRLCTDVAVHWCLRVAVLLLVFIFKRCWKDFGCAQLQEVAQHSVHDRNTCRFRMHSGGADSGTMCVEIMQDSDVQRLLLCYCCLFSPKLERCWLGSAHTDFAHSVSSMSCVEPLLVVFYRVFLVTTLGPAIWKNRAYAELARTRVILLEANVCRDVPVFRHVTNVFVPECVARVPVSLWGSGGGGCVRLTLRVQPFATVRNRLQVSVSGPYGKAYGKFCNRGHFWRFPASRCFVLRGRRGTSWYSDVFCNLSKVVLCGRRNTFASFSEDALLFSWQAQHLGRVHLHFAWQAQRFRRVLWLVLCESHCQGCAIGDKVQISWQAWHFVRCVENWRKRRTKHRFWGCKFSCSKKTRWKMLILKLQSAKMGECLARNARFCCSSMSRLESLVFLWSCHVYGGNCKTYPVSRCQSKL